MPSWNIHTAHVERLLADHEADELGIEDPNAFLFGNYVPDLYLGFMVHDTTYRIDYCLTHLARPNMIPVPNSDRFWDDCIWRKSRRPDSASGMSLALGVWAHLVADRMYNMRFRTFCQSHEVPDGEELRVRKQADFNLFGHALGISSHVQATSELLEAARTFRQYSILPDDVRRSIDVADAIVGEGATSIAEGDYLLLGADWLAGTFEAVNERLGTWLEAWMRLSEAELPFSSADIRDLAGLPPATPDDLDWLRS